MRPPRSNTTDLLAAIAGGDRAALQSLCGSQSARLFGIAMAIVRDRPAASDVLQETFLRVWQRAGQFDPAQSAAEVWLTAIVRHAALDIARSRGREAPADDPGLGDTAIDPDMLDALTAAEDGVRLRDCLQRLEPKARQSIVLGFVHGLSQPEIAALLSEPLGTVKAWIHRGLSDLRACLS